MSVEITVLFEDPNDADEFLRRFEHRELFIRAAIVSESAGVETSEPPEPPSYHDLFITTVKQPRTSIFNLPYGLEVTCERVGGWSLWNNNKRGPGPLIPGQRNPLLVAGEYEGPKEGLRLDVGGHVIVDSLTPRKDKE